MPARPPATVFIFIRIRQGKTEICQRCSLTFMIWGETRSFDAKTRQYAYRTLGVARMGSIPIKGFSSEAVDWMQKKFGRTI